MSKKITRRQITTGAVSAMIIGASGVWRTARAAAPLKVGLLLPRSGFLAFIGQACQRGAEASIPVLVDQGYSVELISADTESNPDVARTQAEKLIGAGANLLMGAFDAGSTAAIAQVCEQNKIPLVVNVGSPMLPPDFKYTLLNFPTVTMLASNGLGLISTMLKATGAQPKTAVLFHVNENFGTAMAKEVAALVPKLVPFKIVETISYAPTVTDLSVEVSKAKAAKADIQLVITQLNDAILMVREMVKQKYEPMGIVSPGSPGMYDNQFFKTLGKYSEYCISNVPWMDPKRDATNALRASLKKLYPDQPFDANAGFNYDALLVAADAHKRAGSTESNALVSALRSTNLSTGVMIAKGPITFDATGQNTNLGSATLQNRDLRPQVVLPETVAENKVVFPVPGWGARH
jgi:branched-chain amino acid transport system substrate-binding protein